MEFNEIFKKRSKVTIKFRWCSAFWTPDQRSKILEGLWPLIFQAVNGRLWSWSNLCCVTLYYCCLYTYIAAYINLLYTIVQVTIVEKMSCLAGLYPLLHSPILLRSCWCFTHGPTQFAFKTGFKNVFGGLSKQNNARVNLPLKFRLTGSVWDIPLRRFNPQQHK